MSERLRTLDSKISFFAFADIITAVSGMLIFITLLLATDLGRPSKKSRSEAADRVIQEQLSDALKQQLETDSEMQRLQELLAAAETAPALEKIEADVANSRLQLAAEQKKQSVLDVQISKSASALKARDAALGLADLKATIDLTTQQAESIARQEAKARQEMEILEQQISVVQTRILKLREREGKLWLIPDKSDTTKEPILVTVARIGAAAYAFDHPEKNQQWDSSRAQSSFEAYLRSAKVLNQYVVFEVKPSGIKLFQSLLESARTAGFDVGFDALEEDKDVQGFSTPPPIEEPVPPSHEPAAIPVPQAKPSTNSPVQTAKSPPSMPPANASEPSHATSAVPSPPPPQKSWWQRFFTWIGLK